MDKQRWPIDGTKDVERKRKLSIPNVSAVGSERRDKDVLPDGHWRRAVELGLEDRSRTRGKRRLRDAATARGEEPHGLVYSERSPLRD